MNQLSAYQLHKFVFSLDRAADRILTDQLGISYRRVLFLAVLSEGSMTQHKLATILGYSDAAVSSMLLELKKFGYVTVTASPGSGRKHTVRLTHEGKALSEKAKKILDDKFAALGKMSGVDLHIYSQLTEQLYKALNGKGNMDENC